ncbi:MAG TPA: ABC transporter ATP-binding protein [Candidatus Kapabacteria bacterium]|nr:ABC transporter ATP-binding protein [Candidatus Kapabacteria bacterium]
MAEPVVMLERVAVGYNGRPVLRDVNAVIARGASVGLLGANGSGKTTLLKAVAGVLRPIGGEIRFPGATPPKVGYVPQRESLDQSFMLSSFEVVLMGACGTVGAGHFLRGKDRDWARECMARTGVADLARRHFAELSGGQKQRVLIARALVSKPDLLLLDEPTAGVDPAATDAIAQLLQSLNAEGMTLLMVNHDLPVVRRVSRIVFWVRNGVLEQGSASEMLKPALVEQLPID